MCDSMLSRLGIISKELCDSTLKIKKRYRFGVLLMYVRQSVGSPLDIICSLFSYMVWYSSRPLGVIKREPQYWCFALKSPPTRNLCPSELMKALYCSFLIAWRGRKYMAEMA
jgi:hypothetical protein